MNENFMKKIRFESIYLLSLAIIFFVVGAFTELNSLYNNCLIESIDDRPLRHLEFLHLILEIG